MSYNFSLFQQKAQKTLEHVKQDINTLRTGRATAQLLDPVMVEAYGTQMKLIEVASVQAQDASLLVVSPWDKSLLEPVAKAIASAGLNLNPVINGDIIRITIAPLTEEKRLEMVKLLQRKVEEGKVMLRNIRGEAKKDIEDMKGKEGVSEDDIKQDLEDLEEKFKTYNAELDEMEDAKQKELMTV